MPNSLCLSIFLDMIVTGSVFGQQASSVGGGSILRQPAATGSATPGGGIFGQPPQHNPQQAAAADTSNPFANPTATPTTGADGKLNVQPAKCSFLLCQAVSSYTTVFFAQEIFERTWAQTLGKMRLKILGCLNK